MRQTGSIADRYERKPPKYRPVTTTSSRTRKGKRRRHDRDK